MIIIRASKKSSSLEDTNEMLSRLRIALKHDPIAQEICREHHFESDILDGIPIKFSDDLDVSAKTVNSEIELNKSLLNETFEVIMRYVIHELVHALQHMEKEDKKKDDNNQDREYLDNPDELEAFQKQIKFDSANRGLRDAVEYAEELVDYHDIPDSKRDRKIQELLKEIKK